MLKTRINGPEVGYSLKGQWKKIENHDNFLHYVKHLSAIFKGKFMQAVKKKLIKDNLLIMFNDIVQKAYGVNWNINCQPSLADESHVVKYLGQYTHRGAITNQRILNIDKTSATFILKITGITGLKSPAPFHTRNS